jgi:hypothetical protein
VRARVAKAGEGRTMCSLLQYTKSGCRHLSHCNAAPSPLQCAHAPDHADAPTALNLHCSPTSAPPPAPPAPQYPRTPTYIQLHSSSNHPQHRCLSFRDVMECLNLAPTAAPGRVAYVKGGAHRPTRYTARHVLVGPIATPACQPVHITQYTVHSVRRCACLASAREVGAYQ